MKGRKWRENDEKCSVEEATVFVNVIQDEGELTHFSAYFQKCCQ